MTQNESAEFWLQVLAELQNRGIKDILIAYVDGLIGFPDAIEADFPKTQVQIKVISLAIGNIAKKWTMPIQNWKPALNRFAIEFGDRFPMGTMEAGIWSKRFSALLYLSKQPVAIYFFSIK